MWHFARGVAFARLGNVLGARSEQKDFEAACAQVADDNAMFQNSQRRIAEVAARVLSGRIAEADGDTAAAIADYEAAVSLEDALNYNEPADWFYPVRETLGAALLREERFADAARVFERDLQRNRHNPRSLWGLAAARRGDTKLTAEYRRRWKGAPLTLASF
jgi:tetratricopeptide (TPR) repeat protein